MEKRKGQEGRPSVLESIHFNFSEYSFYEGYSNSELMLTYKNHL
jgi:hypothetical protein